MAKLAVSQLSGEKTVLDVAVPTTVLDVRPQIAQEVGFAAFDLFIAGEEEPLFLVLSPSHI